MNHKILKAAYLLSVAIMCMCSLIGNIFVLFLNGKNMRLEQEMPKWVNNYLEK